MPVPLLRMMVNQRLQVL